MRYYEFVNKQLDEIYIRQDIGNFDKIPFELPTIEKNKKDWVLKSQDNNLSFYSFSNTSDAISYFCTDGTDIISSLSLYKDGSMYKITNTWTANGFRNKGLMTKLLNVSLSDFGTIYSDADHTPDAKNFWLGIISKYPSKCFIYDTSENKRYPLPKSKDEIWDPDNNHILGIEK